MQSMRATKSHSVWVFLGHTWKAPLMKQIAVLLILKANRWRAAPRTVWWEGWLRIEVTGAEGSTQAMWPSERRRSGWRRSMWTTGCSELSVGGVWGSPRGTWDCGWKRFSRKQIAEVPMSSPPFPAPLSFLSLSLLFYIIYLYWTLPPEPYRQD